MKTGRTLIAALAALLLAAPAADAATSGAAADRAAAAATKRRTAGDGAVTLRASFPPGARLGAETPIRLALRVDTRKAPAAVRELRLRFPASLGLATSGLGAETCQRTVAELTAVMIDGAGLAGCSPNAVMGRGTARAEVRFPPGPAAGPTIVPEYASVTMLAAPFVDERFGLLFLANGLRPFGATLVFAGTIEPAKAPFGGTLLMRAPTVPNQFGVDVALTAIAFEIGSPDLRYSERRGGRTVRYKPEGVVLPPRCPRGAFPFAADLTLADGSRVRAATAVPCPRR
jgi:hypothetical protein